MLVNHLLQLIGVKTNLVDQNVIMHRTRGALDCRVRVQVEVILERMGYIPLHKSTRMWIAVPITSRTGEKPDVMALRSNNHDELALLYVRQTRNHRASLKLTSHLG